MTTHLFEALRHMAMHALECLASPPASADPAGTTNMLNQILKELRKMSDKFDTEMTALRDDVAAQNTVIASATAAFQGLGSQLATALASAKTAGATDEQVASLVTLQQSIESNTATLAAAIPAGTSAAAAPVAPGTAAAPAPAAPAADPAPSTDPAAPAVDPAAAQSAPLGSAPSGTETPLPS